VAGRSGPEPAARAAGRDEPRPDLEPADAKPTSPSEVEQVLEKLSADQRQVLERSFSLMLQAPIVNPVLTKLNTEHLHKILDGVENGNKRMYEDERDERKHVTLRSVVGTLAFLVLCGLFLWAKEVPFLKDLVIYLVLIAGGVGIGRGLMRVREGD